MKDKYIIVKKYIDEYDYYSLLRHGAPEDEFAAEAHKICELITENSSVEEIAEAIAVAMYDSFGNEKNAQKYVEVARKIKTEFEDT